MSSDPQHTFDAFVEMAHRIVWASAATVDPEGRPRTRILHPLWSVGDGVLSGFVATGPTRAKRDDLETSPHMSFSYWRPDQDTCRADCRVTWAFDDETCTAAWNALVDAPEPVGYDPSLIEVWNDPTDEAFAVLRLEPYRIRVFPGALTRGEPGEILTWSE